jgi:hypothetical protein
MDENQNIFPSSSGSFFSSIEEREMEKELGMYVDDFGNGLESEESSDASDSDASDSDEQIIISNRKRPFMDDEDFKTDLNEDDETVFPSADEVQIVGENSESSDKGLNKNYLNIVLLFTIAYLPIFRRDR